MKTVSFLLFFSLSIMGLAQDGFELQNDRMVYKKEFQANGKSVADILTKAKAWATGGDTSAVKPGIIVSEDKAAGKLVLTTTSKFDPTKDRAYILINKLEIEASAGSYQVTTKDIKGYQEIWARDRVTQQPIDYNGILRQEKGGSGTFKPEYVAKYAPVIRDKITSQLEGLHSYINQ